MKTADRQNAKEDFISLQNTPETVPSDWKAKNKTKKSSDFSFFVFFKLQRNIQGEVVAGLTRHFQALKSNALTSILTNPEYKNRAGNIRQSANRFKERKENVLTQLTSTDSWASALCFCWCFERTGWSRLNSCTKRQTSLETFIAHTDTRILQKTKPWISGRDSK